MRKSEEFRSRVYTERMKHTADGQLTFDDIK